MKDDGTKIVAMLRKSSDSAEVEDLLRVTGARSPKLKKGDTVAYVALPKLGLDLVFSDEAYLMRRNDLAIGEGGLLFTSVSFRSAGIPDYTAYSGTLPFGLSFANSQKDLNKLFGKPEWANPDLCAERWVVDGLQIHATYVGDLSAVETYAVAVPPAPRKK